MGYQCWGEDHEDLTEKVEVAKAAHSDDDNRVVIFGVKMTRRQVKPRSPRVVMVTCSEGHENIFEVDG